MEVSQGTPRILACLTLGPGVWTSLLWCLSQLDVSLSACQLKSHQGMQAVVLPSSDSPGHSVPVALECWAGLWGRGRDGCVSVTITGWLALPRTRQKADFGGQRISCSSEERVLTFIAKT